MLGRLSWLIVLAMAAPVLFLLYQAFAPLETLALERVIATTLPSHALNSAIVAIGASAIALLIGCTCAIAIVFFEFPGRKLFTLALVLPLLMPPYLVAIIWREQLHRLQLSQLMPVESTFGLAAILGLSLYPYCFLLVKTALLQQAGTFLDVCAAQSIGLTRSIYRVLLPLVLPAICLGAALVALESFADFGTASVLGVSTMSSAVYRAWFGMFDQTLAAQIALLGLLTPLILLVLIFALFNQQRYAGPSNRQRSIRRRPLRAAPRAALSLYCGATCLLAFGLPFAILLVWSVKGLGRVDLHELYQNIAYSISTSGAATAIACAIAVAIALSARLANYIPSSPFKRSFASISMWLAGLNFALPSMALAVACLSASAYMNDFELGRWLNDSVVWLIAALVVRYSAFIVFFASMSLESVSVKLDDAARSLGRDAAYTWRRVHLPLLKPALFVGALVFFVMGVKELTLAMALQPFGFSSLALEIYQLARVDVYEEAAVFGICLALVNAYPIYLLSRWFDAKA